MRKAAIVLLLLVAPVSLFAQYRDPSWRERRYSPRDNMFELTPHVGYRWGGTIRAVQTDLFNTDVDLAGSANIGATFGIPITDDGMKVELINSDDRCSRCSFNENNDLYQGEVNFGLALRF